MASGRYTLDAIYPPSGSTVQPKVDLVFVHGLGGDQLGTWTDTASGRLWIKDPEFWGTLKDRVRVLAFGYNANIFEDVTQGRIVNHAVDLLEKLQDARVECLGRPIVFIAHSLGGLVVKDAIVRCQRKLEYGDIKSSTIGIIFLGTPHLGSDHVSTLATFQKIASVFTGKKESVITRQLATFSSSVVDIHSDFMGEPSRHMRLVNFFETIPMRLPSASKVFKVELIVPDGSAILADRESRNISMSCTHTEMPKFPNSSDARFNDLWRQIDTLCRLGLARAQGVPSVEERFAGLRSMTTLAGEQQRTINLADRRVFVSRPRYIDRQGSVEIIAADMRRDEHVPDPDEKGNRDRFLDSLSRWKSTQSGDSIPGPQPGTCSWLLTNETYLDWSNSRDSRILFITGASGHGKSCLSKFILRDHLEKLPPNEALILGFFCNAASASMTKPLIFGQFMRQLIEWRPALFRHIHARHQNTYTHDALQDDFVLIDIIGDTISAMGSGTVYFVMDGLNECDPQYVNSLLEKIDWTWKRANFSKKAKSGGTLKILITSQPTTEILNWRNKYMSLEVTATDVESDTYEIVHGELLRMSQTKDLGEFPLDDLARQITSISDGFILWAKHVTVSIESIAQAKEVPGQTSKRAIYEAIKACPYEVGKFYDERLKGLPNKPVRIALMLAIAAIRPLTLRELLDAMSTLAQRNFMQEDLLIDIRKHCSGLIRVSGPDGKVFVHHNSLKEHLIARGDAAGTDDLAWSLTSINILMTQACMLYFSNKGNRETILLALHIAQAADLSAAGDESLKSQLISRCPFLDYAAEYWHIHLASSGDQTKDLVPILHFFLSNLEPTSFVVWDAYTDWIAGQLGRLPALPFGSVIGMANMSNILPFVEFKPEYRGKTLLERLSCFLSDTRLRCSRLLRRQQRILLNETCSMTDFLGRMLLHFAADHGNLILANFCLQRSRLVDHHRISDGATPLHIAILSNEKGSLAIAKELLKAKADINSRLHSGATPLILACASGNFNAAQLLLHHEADPDLTSALNVGPLEVAFDNRAIVLLLLHHDVELDILWSGGATPLIEAIGTNDHELVQLLLAAGACPNFAQKDGIRPLHLAIWWGLQDIFNTLLESENVMVNTAVEYDGIWHSPLSIAIQNEDLCKVEQLLDRGADPDLAPPSGDRPLIQALAAEHYDITCALLSRHCEVNFLDSADRSPLQHVAWRGQDDFVNLLLDHNADPGLEDRYDKVGSLAGAVFFGMTSTVELLLECRSVLNINAAPTSWRSPLYYAASKGHTAIASLLLRVDADHTYADEQGRTPLLEASRGNHVQIVRELIEKGANRRGSLSSSWTPLHAAIAEKHNAITTLLLEEDPQSLIEVADAAVASPILVACSHGNEFGFDALLRMRANTTVVSPQGYNIFHMACRGGNVDLVRKIFNLNLIENAILSRTFDQTTPLMIACGAGHLEVCRFLIERQADVNQRNDSRSSAILMAAASKSDNKVKIINLLFTHSADINDRSNDGNDALIEACSVDNGQAVRLLLRRGADPTRTTSGWYKTTALHHAVQTGSVQLVDALMSDHRVSLAATDSVGRNALHYAINGNLGHILKSMLVDRRSSASLTADLIQQDQKLALETPDLNGNRPIDYIFHREPTRQARREHVRQVLSHAEALSSIDSLKQFELDRNQLNELGRHLNALGDEVNARFAMTHEAIWVDGCVVHSAICDNCRSPKMGFIERNRYHCQKCDDRDMCEQCMDQYDRGLTSLLTCKQSRHVYYKIPSPDKPGFEMDVDQFLHWLALIKQAYSNLTSVSRSGTGLSAVGSDNNVAASDPDALRIIAIFRCSGLPTFRSAGLRFDLANATDSHVDKKVFSGSSEASSVSLRKSVPAWFRKNEETAVLRRFMMMRAEGCLHDYLDGLATVFSEC